MSIPMTILQQLGGTEFVICTGCKDFYEEGNTLHMKLTHNKSGANRLSIELAPNDTYTMVFSRHTPAKFKDGCYYEESSTVVKRHELVYVEELRNIFETVTGLFTSLHPRR